VHNGTIATIAAAKGKQVRLAINLALDVPECPKCPTYAVRINPSRQAKENVIAKRILAHFSKLTFFAVQLFT